jgi:DNA-binding HxlR family transcriptional regulator
MNTEDVKHPQYGDRECITHLNAVGDALYAIGGKWKLKIIIALFLGKKRFNELQRTIDGVSAKVLAGELKELEMNGFINRVAYKHKGIAVEYEATAYCGTLYDVLNALGEWGNMHREKIRTGF